MDRAFISDHATGDRDKAILSNLMRMARELNVGVTAEGVECKTQVDFLAACGCDIFQGYYFGRPMAVAEFQSLIA